MHRALKTRLLSFSILLLLLMSQTARTEGLGCPEGWMSGGDPPEFIGMGCVRQDGEGHLIRYGRWTEFYLNGQKQKEGYYRDGRPIGKWTWWYPNGIKMQEGYYIANHPSGRWLFWNSDGSEIKSTLTSSPSVEFTDLARNMSHELNQKDPR